MGVGKEGCWSSLTALCQHGLSGVGRWPGHLEQNGRNEQIHLLCKAAKHYIDVGVCVSGLLGLPENFPFKNGWLAGWLAGLLPQPVLLTADPRGSEH